VDAERWKRTRALFDEAAELPPAQWTAFLASRCDDSNLAAEVLALLHADVDAAGHTSLSEQAPDLFAGLEVNDDSEEAQQRLGQRYGAWRLVRALAEGGMGVVYLAERVEGDFTQRAALKVVRNATSSAEVLARFRYERQILANLAHPNIARLLDGGAGHNGDPYLAMEYVEGSDLRRYCDEHGLDIEARLRLFLTVCDAVAYAHDRLVLHRDLKPANVLVSQTGEVKLLDFGVAKLIDQQQPAETTVAGRQIFTPEYAAPEQIRGEISTVAVDVYALGVMLYELLTGRRPYLIKGRGAAAIERAVLSTDAPAPSALATRDSAKRKKDKTATEYASMRRTTPERLRQQLRGDLDAIVLKALRKSPQERYATVAAFADDLRAYLARRPVTARRGSRRYRMVRFVQRHAAAIALVSLAALSLIAGSILALWQAREAGLQRDAAVAAREISDKEALKSKTTLAFMNRLFEQADPSRTRGETMTAREILDKGAKQIQQDLTEQPEIRAEMMTAIGKAQIGLGLYTDSLPLLEEATTLNRDALVTHATTAIAYATALARLGRPKDILPVLEPLRERLAHAQGIPPEVLAKVDQSLGSVYQRLQRVDESVQAFQRAVTVQETVLGPDHPDTQATMLGMVNNLLLLGRTAEATAIAERVLASLRKSKDPDENLLGITLQFLARALQESNRIEEAEPLLQEALALETNIFGPDHPNTVQIFSQLGNVRFAQGRYEEALEMKRRVADRFRKSYGEKSYWYADEIGGVAHTLLALGRASEALPLATEALQIQMTTFGEQHYRTALALAELAAVELEFNHFAEAQSLLERALEAWKATAGSTHSYLADPLSDLSIARSLGGFSDPGCEPAVRASTLVEAVAKVDDPESMYHRAVLDACFAAAGESSRIAQVDHALQTLEKSEIANPRWVRMLTRLSNKLHEKS